MPTILDEVRTSCASVANAAQQVRVNHGALASYAALIASEVAADPQLMKQPEQGPPAGVSPAAAVARTFLIAALNFGGGWRRELKQAAGRGGAQTIQLGFDELTKQGSALTAPELLALTVEQTALAFGLPWPSPPAVSPFVDLLHSAIHGIATDLRQAGHEDFPGYIRASVGRDPGTAAFVAALARDFRTLRDECDYDGPARVRVRFLKKAQLVVSMLKMFHAGQDPAYSFPDLGSSLTVFVDNVLPFVLWRDGILELEAPLLQRIQAHDPLSYGEPAEVELRAGALHACELLVPLSGLTAEVIDYYLWCKGKRAGYRELPRHCMKDATFY